MNAVIEKLSNITNAAVINYNLINNTNITYSIINREDNENIIYFQFNEPEVSLEVVTAELDTTNLNINEENFSIYERELPFMLDFLMEQKGKVCPCCFEKTMDKLMGNNSDAFDGGSGI